MVTKLLLLLRYLWSLITLDWQNFRVYVLKKQRRYELSDNAIYGFLQLYAEYNKAGKVNHSHWQTSLKMWADGLDSDTVKFCEEYHSGDIIVDFQYDDPPDGSFV
jgi:hypothetical protein